MVKQHMRKQTNKNNHSKTYIILFCLNGNASFKLREAEKKG